MVNNYQSSRRLENDNQQEHGEHLVSKKNLDNERGHYDHLTLSRIKHKMITSVNTIEHLMNDIRKPKNDDKHE